MPHKKTFLLLFALIALAGLLFLSQIKRFKEITVTRNPTPLISEKSTFIPISETDPILGNPGAPITVIEFMDFSCRQCLAFHSVIKEFIATHPQEMRLVWKDAPKEKIFSKNSDLANRAGWCISQQDTKKFWQFVEAAAESRANLNESGISNMTRGLNLDTEKIWQCANGTAAKQKIEESLQIEKSLDLGALPIIFVNNKLINTREDINLNDMLAQFIKK